MITYKHNLLALYAMSVMALGGCSALGKVTALHAGPDKEGWVARPPIPERSHPAFMRYEFTHETVMVITCSLQVGMSVVAIGPALIPIVPGVLFPFSFDPSTEYNIEDLFIYIQINSPVESITIDFSKVELRTNDSGALASLKSIRRYNENERWPDVCRRHLRVDDETVSAQQVINKGNVQYLLIFDFPWRKVETFSLDIGSLAVGDQQVQLPSMAYRRDSYYFYMPFIIPPGGHDGQEPWIIY